MEDLLNAYTDESLEDWEDNDEMSTWETAFIRGEKMAYDFQEEGG